jgi:ectoine hydroxylase-related dioxygenase (phytanoyl-CoA dioxygenase family)
MEELDRDGYAILEHAVEPELLDRLLGAVNRIWRERADGEALHLLGFVGLDPAFIELLDHPRALRVVVGVLGPNVYVYHCHLDVHPPLRGRPEPTWRWHQDGGRQNIELASPRPLLSLKVAYFLTDVDCAEHGALWLIPRSHRRDRLARPRNGSVVPEGAIPLMVRAGTAVVFDRRLWHARGDNVADRTRCVLFYAYTHRWIRPRDDLLGVDDALLATLDPVRRQLLGSGASTNGYWMPTEDDLPLAMRYKALACASTSSATWKASPASSSGNR